MHRGIKKVYLGLPSHLASKVFWVNREYRLNNLSHIPGGADVIVEYHDESVLGYDWIKMPSKYIKTFWYEHYIEIFPDFDEWNEKQQLAEIKKKVKSIYARKYSESDFETVPFQEVWNFKNSENTPWNALEKVDSNLKSSAELNWLHQLTVPEFCEEYGIKKLRVMEFENDNGELVWKVKGAIIYAGPSCYGAFDDLEALKFELKNNPEDFTVAWFEPNCEGYNKEVIRLVYLG